MQTNEINVQEFVDDRKTDIKVLEKAINSSRKKTMLFQRLPFYKRRRTRSNFVKKNKNTRQKHRHFLKTHIWYAKRFKMVKIDIVSLPLTRNQKSSKYIYKSQNRGFVFDESYKKVLVFNVADSLLLNFTFNRNCFNKIQLVRTEDGFIELILTEMFCIVISPLSFKFEATPLKEIEACISLIKMENVDLSKYSKDIDASLKSEVQFYVENDNEYESGKLFLSSKDVMNTWNDFCLKGCIPVSIEELQRLAVENDYMTHPFDDVNSPLYRILEDTQNLEFIEKYERTPKSKKVAIDFEDLRIQTVKKVHFYVFELDKGVLNKNGFIFDAKNEVIGRIIRGCFCFTIGKSRGLCYTFEKIDIDIQYKAKNYDHANLYNLKIVKEV